MTTRKVVIIAVLLTVMIGAVPLPVRAAKLDYPDPREYGIIPAWDRTGKRCYLKTTGYETSYPGGIVLHHTAGSWVNTPEDVAGLACGQGWSHTEYNILVAADGTVYLLTEPGTRAFHAAGSNNMKYFGISVSGHFRTKELTGAQREGVIKAIRYALALGIKPEIFGHGDVLGYWRGGAWVRGTECPGKNLTAVMKQLLAEAQYPAVAKTYEFSASKQGGTTCAYNVVNFFAWPSGAEVGSSFTGNWVIRAREKKVSLNGYFGPYTTANGMKIITNAGDCACNAASMVRYVLEEAGLKVDLSHRSQQGHVINGVQYPIPGVPVKYWTTVYVPGQDIFVTNPYDFSVTLHWKVQGNAITMWVEGSSGGGFFVTQSIGVPKTVKFLLSGLDIKEWIGVVIGVILVVCVLIFGIGPVLNALAYIGRLIWTILRRIISWFKVFRRKALNTHSPLRLGAFRALEMSICGALILLFVQLVRSGNFPIPEVTAQEIVQVQGINPVQGERYAVTFGSPCRTIGTLGLACSPEEVIQAGKRWQSDVSDLTKMPSVMVLVPRMSHRFTWRQMQELVQRVRQYPDAMVLPEVGGDLDKAYEVVERLTQYGLDGVAFDLEFRKSTTFEEIRKLAGYLKYNREKAGLEGEGVLLLWHVFDSKVVPDGQGVEVPGVRVVVIHDGYGSLEAKVAAYNRMVTIYGLGSESTGWMAFDNRWPVRTGCSATPSTSNGFDCQTWKALVRNSVLLHAAWWAQQ